MQARRYRPGDVLDDYCPRERRITDHAIVAMVDQDIQRTRCAVCDAEHEYKEAKVPAPRRKTSPALFTQVLDNVQAERRPHAPSTAPPTEDETALTESTREETPVAHAHDSDADDLSADSKVKEPPVLTAAAPPIARSESSDGRTPVIAANGDGEAPPADDDRDREGGFRRSLIRATFPRPEGQAPPARNTPEFTLQSLHNRRNNGQGKFRRRRPGGGGMDNQVGPMRFRDHGHGDGRPNGQGGGRRRRGGKKNR